MRAPVLAFLLALGLTAGALAVPAPQGSMGGSTLNGCTPHVRPQPTSPAPILYVDYSDLGSGAGFRLDFLSTQNRLNQMPATRLGNATGGDYQAGGVNITDAIDYPNETYLVFTRSGNGFDVTGKINGTDIDSVPATVRGTYTELGELEAPQVTDFGFAGTKARVRINVTYFGISTAVTLTDV